MAATTVHHYSDAGSGSNDNPSAIGASTTWKHVKLGQYINERKLIKLLVDKASNDGSNLKESDFEIQVRTFRMRPW